MPQKDDNMFTFDTKPFMQGLNKIAMGMKGMTIGAANMARSVSAGVIDAVKKVGLLTLAFKGIQGAIQEMPEIGKAFELTKGIITKNLLFPLRKAVFPLLQGMLDWVRDNRTMFVQWGQTLANIFEIVVSKVKTLIDFGSQLGRAFANFINRTFGLQITTFQDAINVLTFKVAVLFQFFESLMVAIFPLFERIGGVFSNTIVGAFKTIGELVGGFVDSLGNLEGVGSSIVSFVEKIVDNLFSVNAEGRGLFTIMRKIGNITGTLVRGAFESLQTFVDGLSEGLTGIVPAAHDFLDVIDSALKSLFTVNDQGQSIQTLFGEIGRIVGEVIVGGFESVTALAKGFARGADGIVGSLHEAATVMDQIVGFLFTANDDGASLQTIFETIGVILGQVFKGGIETVSAFISGFINGMGNIFTSVQQVATSISEIADSIFNVNAEGNSMQTVFRTIGEILGGAVETIGSIVASFVKGVTPAMENIMTPIQNIVDGIKRIQESLFGAEEQAETLGQTLGEFAGGALVRQFEALANGVDLVASAIEAIGDAIKWITGLGDPIKDIGTGDILAGDIWAGVRQGAGNNGTGVSPFSGDIGAGVGGLFQMNKPVDDAIITADGKVVPVNPNDNILAFKESGALVQNAPYLGGAPAITPTGIAGQSSQSVKAPITVNLDMSGTQVYLQNGTQEEAVRVAEIMQARLLDGFRKEITMELQRSGVR